MSPAIPAAAIERRADGNWTLSRGKAEARPRPCLILDRDGVLIEERNYLSDPRHVAVISGAVGVIRRARSLGWAVVEVTNQAGIGRGYFGWDAFEAVERRLEALLAADGVALDMVLACPFHADGVPPFARDDWWRKPNPGMILAAREALNLDLSQSILVGDRLSDLQAAERAGVAKAAHVATGHGKEERERVAATTFFRTDVLQLESIADIGTLLESADVAGDFVK